MSDLVVSEALAAIGDALGEWWRIRSLTEVPGGWEAVATDGRRIRIGFGNTPDGALGDLIRLAASDPYLDTLAGGPK